MTFNFNDPMRYTKTGVRWLCPCGEGTGVRADDEDVEFRVKWKPRTPFHVLSERVAYREHVRLTHGGVL